MDVRLIAGSLLLLAVAATATAQEGQKPQGKPGEPARPAASPTPAPAGEPKAQDPDKPQPKPEQVADQLAKEKERLSREIAYAKDRAKNAKADLAVKLKPHADDYRAIDAGVIAVPVPPAVTQPLQPRNARLGAADEFANQDSDAMMLVNGRPVSRRLYEQLMDFRNATAAPTEKVSIAASVLFELIQVEAVASGVDDNETRERVGEIEMQLDGGKKIADMVKDVGVLPGAGPDGHFETARNSMFGTMFASRAFSTEAGKRTRPFRNAQGVVVMQVDKVTKGEKPELDTVSGIAMQVPYSDAAALQKAQTAVHTGQIDIVVRDKDVFDLLPPMFRHDTEPQMVPAQGIDVSRLRTELDRIAKEMEGLAAKDDDASKARREALGKQYELMKRQLRMAEAGIDASPQEKSKVDPAKGDQPKADQPKADQPKSGATQGQPKPKQ